MVILMVNTMLSGYLDDFEKSTPEYYIENFAKKLQTGDYKSVMQSLNVKETEFFTEDDYIAYLEDTFGENPQNIKVFGGARQGEKYEYEFAIEGKNGIFVEVYEHKGDKALSLSTYSIKQVNLPYNEMMIFAPKNATVLADGIPLTSKHLQPEIKKIQSFETLTDKTLVPELASYKLDGFIRKPEITVDGFDFLMSDDGQNIITVKPDPQIAHDVEEFAKTASVAYAKFVSKDAKFAEYTKYLTKESTYFNSIRDFSNHWYVDHTAPEVIGLKAENTIQYSDKAFTTEVSFDYKVVTVEYKIEQIYKTKYILSIIKEGDSWKIANLVSI